MTQRLATLMLMFLLVTMNGLPVAATSTTTDCVEPWESEVAHLINNERSARGLSRLTIVDTLSAASEHFVQSYSHYGWTAHVLASGTSWADNQRDHGYDSNTWRGQVVAMGQQSPTATVAAWMTSPSHRDTILSPHYHVLGSGYTKDANGVRFWAVDFGGARDAPADWC